MKDTCTYTILLWGAVTEEEINPLSPIRIHVEPAGPAATRLLLSTDQAGLIGLLNYLHGMGFVLMKISREKASIS